MAKVEIGIFNTGRTMVDRAEVQRWLDFMGVQDFQIPDDETISDPALLIALAGKRCYRSFEVNAAQNPNITKIRKDYGEYLDNVLASGHGSVLEHSVYTFAIENVSRVFTAEMNRHRAGWAISEGSMRFIRFSKDIPYWEPDSIRGPDVLGTSEQIREAFIDQGPEPLLRELKLARTGAPIRTLNGKKQMTREVFRAAFENQTAWYAVMEKLWEDELSPASKFAGKKEITSLMRRIVGLGVATGGKWTGNIRALRHVLTMRCAPSAEEEILHVFSRICVMMKEKEPFMFGDFEKDGAGFWVPRYKKV